MKKNPVYVVGHKNPDTDAIVSAIAYAQFKRLQGVNAVAGRIGSVSSETEYLLERFGFEDPKRLYTAKSILREIEMDKAATAYKEMTMKDALDKVKKLKNRGLIVVNKKKHLEGIVTLDDLTYMWTKSDEELAKIIQHIEIDDIVRILEGKLVLRGTHKLSGKMHMFPSLKSNVEDDSIVLLRNEDDKLQYCLQLGATMLVVCTSSPISRQVLSLARDAEATIVTTELTPLYITRLIYQTPAIEYIMIPKEKIDFFNINDTVDEASKKIAKSRHRSYPVLDNEGKVVGAISRYHLFNYEHKEFILVTGCTCGLHKGGLTGRSPAKAPLFNGGVLYSAFTVIAVSNCTAFSGLELVLEELTGKFRYRHQALMALAGGNLLCGFLLFLNLYIIFLCKIAEGFRVREMVIIHKETHGASGLAAAEALVDAL